MPTDPLSGMDLSLLPSGPWTQVGVLLSHGNTAAAQSAAEIAAASTPWQEFPRMRIGGPAIYGMAEVPRGWAFFQPFAQRLVINDRTLGLAKSPLYQWARTLTPRYLLDTLFMFDERSPLAR